MSLASAEEAKKHVRLYLVVGAALLGLTLVTVAVSYLHLPVPYAVAVALLVAIVKGGLVAAVFMHLLTERQALFTVLGICVVFFFALMLLPVATESTNVLQ